MTAYALEYPIRRDLRSRARPNRGAAWAPYLAMVAFLVPLVVPYGPGQTAIVDVLNIGALLAFTALVLVGRRRLALPLVGPVMLIAAGSLLAVSHAESIGQSALTLAQDLYLYLWFVMVVTMMRELGDTRRMRIAWVLAADLYAVIGLAMSWSLNHGQLTRIVGPTGIRVASTFYNPNMFADYLVLSLFVILSLAGRAQRRLLWGSAGLLVAALITTKSNGGMIALLSGLSAWLVARVLMGRRGLQRLLAGALLVASAGLTVFWLASNLGIGSGALADLREHTFMGRMQHSSESRMHIWDQLERTYARSPLGIGPGNSGSITLALSERERPGGSLQGKEAHSDYLAFAVERGPLALLGLLLMIGQVFWQLFRLGRSVKAGRAPVTAAWTAAMIGALAATSVHSTVIEKLHFRHFWLFLALICVVRERTRSRSNAGRTEDHGTAPVPTPPSGKGTGWTGGAVPVASMN